MPLLPVGWRPVVRVLFCMASALTLSVALRADHAGYALRFDGVSDAVRLAETARIMGPDSGWESSKSVSLWVKPTGTSWCANPSPAACDAVIGDRPRTWGISRGLINGDDRFWAWTSNSGGTYSIGIPYTPGEWVHLALVHDQGVLRAYRNGELVSSVVAGPTGQPPGFLPTLYLGGVMLSSTRNWTFEGELDEVRVWRIVRSEDDIRRDMNQPLAGNENGLAAYYRMSDGAGLSLTDDSGNGWTGTLVDGGPGVPADGPVTWVPSGAFDHGGDPGNNPPAADSQAVTTAEDTAVALQLTGSDPDEDALTFQVTTAPAFGSLTGTPPDLVYMPGPHFNGSDGFTFVARDGSTASPPANVSITVAPVNDAPGALDTSVAADEGTSIEIDLGLLVSDVETPSANLLYAIVDAPPNGALSGTGQVLLYTPRAGFTGEDAFTYQVTDRGDPTQCVPGPGCSPPLSSPVRTVSVTVRAANATPVAHAQELSTAEDVPLDVTLTGSDADGDPLTFRVTTQPARGVLLGSEPFVRYVPDADANGADSFTFVANDGRTDSPPAVVTLSISAVNDPPVANDDAGFTTPDTALVLPVLDNDDDVDGDVLVVAAVGPSASGTVVNNGDSVTYTPAAGFTGRDTFSYTAADPAGDTANAIVTVDVGVTGDLVEIGAYDTPGDANDLVVAGGYAYIADRSSGLQIVDVSDPARPQPVGALRFSGGAAGVDVVGAYAYVANASNGLRIVDVSEPSQPREVAFHDTPGYAADVEVEGRYAHVADRWGGVSIIDVSDPLQPREAGFYRTASEALDVAIAGDYLLVAEYESGVRVLDVSDPADPVFVGLYRPPHLTYGVTVVGTLAYVASGASGLRILDIANPAVPREVGAFDTDGFSRSVAVQGRYAYVADWIGGLVVVDVSSPAEPAAVGIYDSPGRTRDVAVLLPHVFIADYEAGLRVLRH